MRRYALSDTEVLMIRIALQKYIEASAITLSFGDADHYVNLLHKLEEGLKDEHNEVQ